MVPFVEMIAKKRDGRKLSIAEIEVFVKGAAEGTLPNEQLAAMLMAIRLRGMDAEETAQLSLAMAASGEMADLSEIPGVKVDKHSSGGVGDTTTLLCVPIAAACGVKTVKMSGRSLGHTGGTLDKLWAIPGMRTDLSSDEILRQTLKIGCALAGQSAALAPADKKLYALRDITATVDSPPLIASSILSKKIAAGADAIVLDIKAGSGALMPNYKDSLALAREMAEIGRRAGRKVAAVVSDMNQPLGNAVGNALEVREAIGILKDKGAGGGRLLELSLLLSAHMILLAGLSTTKEEALALARGALTSGKALARMGEWIAEQGGDARVISDESLLPAAPVTVPVFAEKPGYIERIHCDQIGLAAHMLGAGRAHMDDSIDASAGLVMQVRLGGEIYKDEPICVLHGGRDSDFKAVARLIQQCVEISEQPVSPPPLVYESFD